MLSAAAAATAFSRGRSSCLLCAQLFVANATPTLGLLLYGFARGERNRLRRGTLNDCRCTSPRWKVSGRQRTAGGICGRGKLLSGLPTAHFTISFLRENCFMTFYYLLTCCHSGIISTAIGAAYRQHCTSGPTTCVCVFVEEKSFCLIFFCSSFPLSCSHFACICSALNC